MDNTWKQIAQNAGIDIDSGVERFSGNEMLYEKFLHRFADDKSYSELVAALSDDDCSAAFNAAHTLKGVSGNLSLIRLQEIVSEQVEYLRLGDLDAGKRILEEVSAAYKDILKILS